MNPLRPMFFDDGVLGPPTRTAPGGLAGPAGPMDIDWGCGVSDRGRNVIYRHSYANGRFRDYTVSIRT